MKYGITVYTCNYQLMIIVIFVDIAWTKMKEKGGERERKKKKKKKKKDKKKKQTNRFVAK